MPGQELAQSSSAAGMDPGNGNVVALGFLGRCIYHFVRNSIGKQDHKIRIPQFFLQASPFFGKYFGFASVIFTDGFVLADHTLVASDNYYTHGIEPPLRKSRYTCRMVKQLFTIS